MDVVFYKVQGIKVQFIIMCVVDENDVRAIKKLKSLSCTIDIGSVIDPAIARQHIYVYRPGFATIFKRSLNQNRTETVMCAKCAFELC